MATLRELTETIQQHPGVRSVVLLEADGLVIETDAHGQAHAPTRTHHHADAVAARVPGVAAAARQLGEAAGVGEAQFVLLEFDAGYGIVMRLSPRALLFVSASADVALSELLYDLRRHRAPMTALV